jgi:hypothetical protein
MARWIWVFGLICAYTLPAQPRVTIQQTVDGISIFGWGSPEFSAIVSSLGATSTLAALGPSSELFVAIRNNSTETVESMRVLFEVETGQKPLQSISIRGTFAPGTVKLAAPYLLDQVAASAGPHNAAGLGLGQSAGPTTTLPLAYLNGATTVSVDSVTFTSGLFAGDDKLGSFDRLVETAKASRSFLAIVSAMRDRTDSEIASMLQSQRDTARNLIRHSKGPSDLDLSAMEIQRLSTTALMKLQTHGAAAMMTWAETESNKLAAKPTLHRR